MNTEALREKERIKSLFDLTSQLPSEEEVLAHWARYLCVACSGAIERSIVSILTDYSARVAAPTVGKYVSSRLKTITSLNEEKVGQLIGSFSGDWYRQFCEHTDDEIKNGLDSLVANRHNIAHGRPVGITVARVREYYGHAQKVVIWIDRICA